jgi:hypothetical protein
MSDPSPASEFDLEATEGDDGELALKGAPLPQPGPEPPPPPPAAPFSPPPEVRRIGRPRNPRTSAAPPVIGASLAPNIDISRREDAWPKDAPSLWMHILAWAKEHGHGPEALVIYVHQMRSALGTPMQMQIPIYGDQVMGSEDQSPGDALIAMLTDDFHLPTTADAANYRLEFKWRATGAKIKLSEPYPLDKRERIERLRYVAQQRAAARDGGPPPPFPPYGGMPPYYGAPYAPSVYLGAAHQHLRVPAAGGPGAESSAPVPLSAPPPPTGNPYADQYIADLRAEKERLEQRVQAKDDELSYLRPPAAAPPPPAPPPAPTVADRDAEQARLAATISQTLLQTLLAAGVISKPAAPGTAPPAPPPPPTQAAADEAVGTIRANTSTLEHVLDELERAEKLKVRMREVLGVPAAAAAGADDDDDSVVAEPAELPLRVFKMPNGSGGFINFPRYEKDDDETTTAQKIVNFFGANPDVTKDVIGHVMGIAMSKLSDGPLASLLGQLLTQGGAGAVAAGMARSAVHGAAAGSVAHGGAGSA